MHTVHTAHSTHTETHAYSAHTDTCTECTHTDTWAHRHSIASANGVSKHSGFFSNFHYMYIYISLVFCNVDFSLVPAILSFSYI